MEQEEDLIGRLADVNTPIAEWIKPKVNIDLPAVEIVVPYLGHPVELCRPPAVWAA